MDVNDIPPCASCGCLAWRHIKDLSPDFEMADDKQSATQRFVLGACSQCACTGYTLEVPNPRMSVKLEGI